MQFLINFILKFQLDLLSFSFHKSENMNRNIHKTVVDDHFHPLAHENGNQLQKCIDRKIEKVVLYKIY